MWSVVYLNVSDGQTDGRTVDIAHVPYCVITVLCVASHGEKGIFCRLSVQVMCVGWHGLFTYFFIVILMRSVICLIKILCICMEKRKRARSTPTYKVRRTDFCEHPIRVLNRLFPDLNYNENDTGTARAPWWNVHVTIGNQVHWPHSWCNVLT